jgi:hypothetical protein
MCFLGFALPASKVSNEAIARRAITSCDQERSVTPAAQSVARSKPNGLLACARAHTEENPDDDGGTGRSCPDDKGMDR